MTSSFSKKALIFSPYLDTIGGGEVYTMYFARALIALGYRVELAWHDERTLKVIKKILGIKLDDIILNPHAYRSFRDKQPLWERYRFTKDYDLTFFLSDGSLPFLFSKQNIVHFQVPFVGLKLSLINRLKLRSLKLVCNSIFTKKIIDQHLRTNSTVLWPPVRLRKSGSKTNTILSVGRFTDGLHHKRQDVMIDAFKTFYDQGNQDWRLILVGTDFEGKRITTRLQKMIKKYPIDIMTDLSFSQLNQVYSQASIYWHAAGFGIDENKHPEKVEHFGISTVEAMSAGCVPIVIRKGGQKEIVRHNHTGFLFDSKPQLIAYTNRVIADDQLCARLRVNAIKASSQYSLESFAQNVKNLLET